MKAKSADSYRRPHPRQAHVLRVNNNDVPQKYPGNGAPLRSLTTVIKGDSTLPPLPIVKPHEDKVHNYLSHLSPRQPSRRDFCVSCLVRVAGKQVARFLAFRLENRNVLILISSEIFKDRIVQATQCNCISFTNAMVKC